MILPFVSSLLGLTWFQAGLPSLLEASQPPSLPVSRLLLIDIASRLKLLDEIAILCVYMCVCVCVCVCRHVYAHMCVDEGHSEISLAKFHYR